MNQKAKIVMSSIIVVVIVGLAAIQVSNKEVVQGKITANPSLNVDTRLPDLSPTIKVLQKDDKNVNVEVSIENIGEGIVRGDQEYNYTLYVNDKMVFTNTDTYSEMGPGNKFSFTYPIAKDIYNYTEKGFVRVMVDKDSKVSESNEDNNEAQAEY